MVDTEDPFNDTWHFMQSLYQWSELSLSKMDDIVTVSSNGSYFFKKDLSEGSKLSTDDNSCLKC
jgi:hypothetical protein